MIERYSRPAMKKVWSDENKYRKWLDVELAACEAWTEDGAIPTADMPSQRGHDSTRRDLSHHDDAEAPPVSLVRLRLSSLSAH